MEQIILQSLTDINAIVALGAAIFTLTIGIISGVLAFLFKELWELKTQGVNENSNRINSLEEQIRGHPGPDEGLSGEIAEEFNRIHDEFENIHDVLEEAQLERQRNHADVSAALADVIYVLEQEGMNGDLPDVEDFDRDYFKE